jgi:hypothetical protein
VLRGRQLHHLLMQPVWVCVRVPEGTATRRHVNVAVDDAC